MAFITVQLKSNEVSKYANGDVGAVIGKNGFLTRIGSIPLLVNTVSVIETGPSSNGNVEMTIEGLSQLVDLNFNKHVLEVNDGAYSGLKGSDYISIPLDGIDNSGVNFGFVSYNPTITEHSANLLSYNLTTNNVKIENTSIGAKTLFNNIPAVPFFAKISQIIDVNNSSNGYFYVEGTSFHKIALNNVSANSGLYSANLGVIPIHKNFITMWVDGIEKALGDFTYDSGGYFANITLAGTENEVKTLVDHYTVPTIEHGDNISVYAENVYSILGVSYDPADAHYNASFTANSFYRINIGNNLTSNLATDQAVNITSDIRGTFNNLDIGAATLTLDYNDTTYPGRYNLTNNKLYSMVTRTDFTPTTFAQDTIIRNVPLGMTVIRARNQNTAGRLSPYTTQRTFIRDIPMQRVTGLSVTEYLHKDTTQGVTVRILVEFDALTGQDVSDYEIAWKVTGDTTDLVNFNAIKIPSSAVETDGKMRVVIENLERGRTSGVNSVTVKVLPLNGTIRGIPTSAIKEIIGKTAAPLNITDVAGGQLGTNMLFIWGLPTESDGTPTDIDLNEIEIRKSVGNIASADRLTAWVTSISVQKVATPATSLVLPIDTYGEYTFLFRTIDTTGNQSSDVKGIHVNLIRPSTLGINRSWSEGAPDGNVAVGLPNENRSNNIYESFADSVTGGVAIPAGDKTDNANGTSSGWATVVDPDDLLADSNAFYQTQVRDIGVVVKGIITVSSNGTVALGTSWNNLHEDILTSTTEVGTISNVLTDTSSGGIGHILGFSNGAAATVTYSSTQGTLVSGGASGNVFGIWNPGQFAGDTSNANSFCLIAGVINADAIELGATAFASGEYTGGNLQANLATKVSSYELVDLQQFSDDLATQTWQGQLNAVTTNVEIRVANTTPYYANGNVNAAVMIGGDENEGWRPLVAAEREFRWFQLKHNIVNNLPSNHDYVLDTFDYTLDASLKPYEVTVNVIAMPTTVDYSSVSYIDPPTITPTSLVDGAYIPVVVSKTKDQAEINVYNDSGVAVSGILVNVQVLGA